MLYEEDGPFRIFLHLRIWAGISHKITYTETGEIDVTEVVEDTFMAQLLSCPYCLSVWLSVPAAIGIYYHWFDGLAIAGCIAGLVHLLMRVNYDV